MMSPHYFGSMFGKHRWLVADEPVEFEKYLVEVQDFKKFTNHFRGSYKISLKWMKANPEDVNL